MHTKTRNKCVIMLGIFAVSALYATAAWRVEQARNVRQLDASCSTTMCIPHSATLNALR
ncbi:MAG: hypothetical protein PW845_00925 [Pseudomonas sp.]|nr:hypothetical protein [Pseudomonas sp.]